MLRLTLATLMLLPGVAHAQKFVSATDDSTYEIQQPSTVSVIGGEAVASDVVAGTATSYGIVAYEEDGETILSIGEVAPDEGFGTATALAGTATAEIANLEGGECNSGSTWDALTAQCLSGLIDG